MNRQIFVNLPVANLKAARAFFEKLGFSFNAQFSNDSAACMIVGEHNYAMLLTHEFFSGFISKPLADAHKATGVLVAISLESREAVDRMLAAAIAAGGKEPRAAQDHGFMFSRAFEDLDGHVWEPFWMDPAHVQQQN